MELIKITEQNGKSAVSARELYRFLEPTERFANWMGRNFQYGLIEGTDYTPLTFLHPQNNQEVTDFALTIDCAMHISMIQRSEKGRQARQYFIDFEKSHKQTQLPTTYKEALIALVAQVEENEKQALQIAEMEPKVEFYDAVMKSEDTIDIGELSKVLNCGLGRNKLFQRLREEKILMSNNIPYQSHITSGHFKIIETTFKTKDEQTHIHLKTVVFQKGVDYIRKVLKGK